VVHVDAARRSDVAIRSDLAPREGHRVVAEEARVVVKPSVANAHNLPLPSDPFAPEQRLGTCLRSVLDHRSRVLVQWPVAFDRNWTSK